MQYGHFDDKGAQSWSVLSGFTGGTDRGRKAMDAVEKYLTTDKGIKLSWPGYTGFDRTKGGVTTYPPGAKENGDIFLHPNPWAIIAETMLGDGDRAFSYYSRINPAAKNDSIDEYEGLQLDPCIPAGWDGFTVERKCRGALYHISVRNPNGTSKGIASMTVDGKPHVGSLIPWFESGIHTVEAIRGK